MSASPGPWSTDEDDEAGNFIRDREGYVITEVPGYADARLIAAAPDMLEALIALQRQALQSPDLIKTEWGQEALAMAHAAITKAEGRS